VQVSENAALATAVSNAAGTSSLNQRLLSALVSVNLDENAEGPTAITVDVSEMELTPQQMEAFTGVMFDEEGGDFIYIEGEFSEDGLTFTFLVNEDGLFGVMVKEAEIAADGDTSVQQGISSNVSDAVAADNTAANAPALELTLQIGSNEFQQNGVGRETDVTPFIDPDSNRTMVPLRLIAEGLGAEVSWDDETRTVSISNGLVVIALPLGVDLPGGMGAPMLVDDRTFVPVAYVAQMLGATVGWDEETRSVSITRG
jgi:hypothetical protein